MLRARRFTAPSIIVASLLMVSCGGDSATTPVDDTDGKNGKASVIVGPLGICLKPGASQAFDATVSGVKNQAVTWSTDPPGTGSFSGNVYTAPGTRAGTVVIVATSVADATAKGSATITVGGCECWWVASISGDRSFDWSGTSAVWTTAIAGLSSFAFETQVSGPGIHYPMINGYVAATLSSGATGTYLFPVNINLDADNSWTPGDPNSEEVPEVTIISNDGETVEGYASGPFFRLVSTDPEEYEVLRLDLHFKTTDGSKALCQD